MDTLGILFGSLARVRLMRLFVFNPGNPLDVDDAARRSKVPPHLVRRELAILAKAGLVKPRTFTREVAESGTTRRRRTKGFILNGSFSHLSALSSFLENMVPVKDTDIVKKLAGVGRLKFVVIAGVLVNDMDNRIDILIVGDAIKKALLERAIANIEAHLGRELRYAVFSTYDFKYRLAMSDRFIRDVLHYPHSTVIDRFGITA